MLQQLASPVVDEQSADDASPSPSRVLDHLVVQDARLALCLVISIFCQYTGQNCSKQRPFPGGHGVYVSLFVVATVWLNMFEAG